MYAFGLKILLFLNFSMLFYDAWARPVSFNPFQSIVKTIVTPTEEQKIVDKTLSTLRDFMARKNVPGCAMAIVHRNKVIYEGGFGVRSMNTGAPITPQTVFQLGSLSKPVSTALIQYLINEGLLSLNDRFENPEDILPPEAHNVTLRHILTHSTGIPRFGLNALIESERYEREELLKRLTRITPKETAGQMYDYNNLVFSLAALMVEHKTNLSFPKALKKYLFSPLHMHTASATMEGLLEVENHASPHQKDSKRQYHAVKYRKGYYQAIPGGGINASLRDMEQFLLMQLGHKQDFLPKESLDLLHTPHMHAKDVFEKNQSNINRFRSSFYGIGWRILDYEGHKIVFHGGWVKGFINIILFVPEKEMGIVILQNAETSLPWVVGMTFADAVLGLKGHIWEKKSTKKTSNAPISTKNKPILHPSKAMSFVRKQRKLTKFSRKLMARAKPGKGYKATKNSSKVMRT